MAKREAQVAKKAGRCPTCQKPVTASAAQYSPFCCGRCKDIDLSKWLDGSYRISRPASPYDTDVPVATDES